MALYRTYASSTDEIDFFRVKNNCETISFNGNNRRLPAGIYVTDEPLIIERGDLRGAGKDKTVIIADFPDRKKPILYAGGTPYIDGITLCYRDGLVSGDEKYKERVGIVTTKYWPLQKGACIRNVAIKNVGTGILSDKKIDDIFCTAFSVMFEDISIIDFSYRGFDFISNVRTGNIYKDIELSSGKYTCDSAFYFSFDTNVSEESETDITSLKIYSTIAKQPVVLGGARALTADKIVFENVTASDGSFIIWEKSSGAIGNLEINNSELSDSGTIMRIGSTDFSGFNTLNYMRIGYLKLNNIYTQSKEFKLIIRDGKYTDPFYINIEKYILSSDTDADIPLDFPVSGCLTFIKKGAESFNSRLCPYYSKTSDSSGRVLTWTGNEWK